MAPKLGIAEQIGQLIAVADATTHEDEKQVAWQRAQKLMSRYSIDLAEARAAVAKNQKREQPIQKHVVLGERGQRALAYYVELFTTIARNNDVKCNIAHNSTYVIAFGFPSDIELVETLYASTILSMVQLGDAFLKEGSYKNDIQTLDVKKRRPNPWYTGYSDEPKYEYYWVVERKPVSGMTARQNFYAGFCSRIGSRLREARQEAIKERDVELGVSEENSAQPVGTALVLKEKALEVADFYKQTSNAKGSYRGSRSPVYSSGSRAAGANAANGVNLGGRTGTLPGSRKRLGA